MAKNDWVLELGFDLDSKPGQHGFLLLPSLVNVTHPNNPAPGWLTKFQSGDSLQIRVANYTRYPLPSDAITFSRLELKIYSTLANQIGTWPLVSAFDSVLNPLVVSTPPQPKTGSMVIPGSKQPISYIYFPDPQNPLQERSFTFKAVQAYTTYQMFVAAEIPANGSIPLRKIGHDPEIIVGPGT